MSFHYNKSTKLLTIGALSILLLTTPTLAFANESEPNDVGTGAMLNDPTLTKSLEAELEELAKEKDQWLEETLMEEDFRINNVADGEYYSIHVTNYKQENGYYCGPAAARQSLSFHKSKSGSSTGLPGQSTLASKIGTTKSGSTTTGIASALNSYKGTFSFSSNTYVAADITNVSSPRTTFENRMKGVLKNKTNAPIVLLETRYLDRYDGKSIRHYNTISAYSYDYTTGKKRMRAADPHYDAKYRGTHWDPIGSTSSKGIFRAVYEADKAGSNKAMAY
ncbi:Peptidase_C39 like family protein [Evansella caseinilytica]|uniref:Peptidase_C39 like family protein n=1 Tax=Evansella caseinilytica TaxID=1503961 RepID=A0A1H3SNI2_9BACI|nr:C39 family peptidase [Evansella caseinilytica]SDZ39277.1 Peptidase_C39 like family protein [Evansella caseinilytica]